MSISELARIAEIDRSEHITQQYRARGGNLELIAANIHAPRWGEPGEHSVQHYVDSWRPLIEAGGVLLGAFDGDRLAGFAVYDPSRPEGAANLAVLHVSREYRGKGIGSKLTAEVVRLARTAGVPRLTCPRHRRATLSTSIERVASSRSPYPTRSSSHWSPTTSTWS